MGRTVEWDLHLAVHQTPDRATTLVVIVVVVVDLFELAMIWQPAFIKLAVHLQCFHRKIIQEMALVQNSRLEYRCLSEVDLPTLIADLNLHRFCRGPICIVECARAGRMPHRVCFQEVVRGRWDNQWDSHPLFKKCRQPNNKNNNRVMLASI